jgi:translocation and assembly module TamA
MAGRVLWRHVLAGVTLGVSFATLPAPVSPARAFGLSSLDVFGWFGGDEAAPKPSATALPYKLSFIPGETGDFDEVKTFLRDASNLYKLREDAPPDGEVLAQRASADIDPLIDALWAVGYFNGEVTITVAGVAIRPGQPVPNGLAQAAERYRNREAVPIEIRFIPGPLFAIGTVSLEVKGGITVPPKIVGLPSSSPATSAELRASQARIIARLRGEAHPLARVASIRPVVDHATKTMDVAMVVDPGPVTGFGDVAIEGNKDVPEAVIRSFIYLERGEPFSPKRLEDTRKSIATIPAVGGARIKEGETLDGDGNLPLNVNVSERPKHLVGFSARYSTVDGPALQTYWEHRNLFGGAERLRLESSVFYAPRIDGTEIKRFKDFTRSDLGARFAFHFEKPALAGSRNDLLVDGLATRERIGDNRLGGYTARYADLTAVIRHRFSERFSIQGGLEYERGQTSDALGQVDYSLVGVPLAVKYDSTDSLLDPTQGVRITASTTPYAAFGGTASNFIQTKISASTYYALDEDAKYVLAARVGFGSLLGGSLAEIPSNHRFYAGGSGSVRGYAYRSLSPLSANGQIIGGRSQLDGSLEARIKITKTIGIVPFIDAGNAFRSSYPDFKGKVALGAGIGLRYYTPIGPIRVDVATPLNPRPNDRPIALYISIGQAF